MAGPHEGFKKISFQPNVTPTEKMSLPYLPDINGLRTEKTEQGKYHIVHETGIKLGFVLQGPKEAADMKHALARLMVVQETCRETKKLKDSCKAYTEVSALNNNIGDLYIDNSNLVPGEGFQAFDYKMPSEKIEAILRGSKFKHSLKDGTLAFTEGISKFLNAVQDSEAHLAAKRANQVAGR